MTFENKKEHVIRFVDLGMDLYKACLNADLTDEEVDLLDEDDAFLKRVEQSHALLERKLLEKINTGMATELDRGSTVTARWYLERLNPERWGNKTTINGAINSDAPDPSKIKCEGVYPDGKKSNTES